jgi:hypothetical protein
LDWIGLDWIGLDWIESDAVTVVTCFIILNQTQKSSLSLRIDVKFLQ